MNTPIADLHCDLLVYLQNGTTRSPHDPASRCSIEQMREGNVRYQILPVYVETNPRSSIQGAEQVDIFRKLPHLYPDAYKIIRDMNPKEQIGIGLAFENAAGLCNEEEPLEKAWKTLDKLEHDSIKVVYISMTWNEENRFGGGAHTKIGLKSDGMKLLDFLHQRKTAIDLSHTSDPLAEQILNYIEKRSLDIPVIASHSNFRAVENALRNLPDYLAKEIFRRNGIIGMNFVRYFIGKDSTDNFVRQLEHGFKLGGQNQICFGADFFFGDDVSAVHRKPPEVLFFPDFDNSSCYPRVLELWNLPAAIADQVAHQNLKHFLQTQIFI